MDIYEALQAASSQDPLRTQAGFAALQEIQKRPGAFAEMLGLAANRSFPIDARRIAIIQFKNAAVSQWRSRSVFTQDQRRGIQEGLTTFFDEPDDMVAQTSALIIAKLFRIDSAQSWPQLLPGLSSIIQKNARIRFSTENPPSEASLILRRSLCVLNQVLKETSAVRIPAGVQLMMGIVKDTDALLTDYYGKFSTYLISILSPSTIGSPQVAADVQVAHLLYKCLAKSMAWLWSRPISSSAYNPQLVTTFFASSAPQFQRLFDLRVKLLTTVRSSGIMPNPVGRRTIELLTKHIISFGKLFRKLQQPAIPKFVTLPGCSDLVLYYWRLVLEANGAPSGYTGDNMEAVYPTRVLLQGMVLFKDCLGQWTSSKQANIERGNPLLNQEFVTQAVELIVTKFLPLKPSDLEKWEADPEEWVIGEMKDYESWEFDMRICAERILMTLLDKYPHFVTPLLTSVLASTLSGPPPSDLDSILPREAVYFSIGGHYNRLRSSINIHPLVAAFAVDVQNPSPAYRILKYRIAWVLGKSTPEEQISPGAEPVGKIWEILARLLQDRSVSSDLAVRLSAAMAVRERIDCLAFDSQALTPYLANITSALMSLIAEVDSLESKTQITKTLNTVIANNVNTIIPFINMITDPIPQLWASSEKDYLFKAALIDTLTQLVQATKEQSSVILHIVIPMIQESLKRENIVQLDGDALELWRAALRNAGALRPVASNTPGLMILAPIAVRFLAENLDLLGSMIWILEGYLLLDAPAFLQAVGLDLHLAFAKCVQAAMPTNTKDLLSALEMLILLAPSALWALPMYDSGFFKSIIETVLANKGASDLNNAYLRVIARLVLSDAATFLQMFSSIPNENASQNLDKLLDVWWRQFDTMGEPRQRKLTAMAMGALVATGRPEVMSHLNGDIFNVWLDVFGEMKEARESDQENHLTLYWRDNGNTLPDEMMRDAEGTPEEGRRRLMYKRDPVNSTLLTSYVNNCLAQAKQAVVGGPAAFDSILRSADLLVLKQIQDAVSRNR